MKHLLSFIFLLFVAFSNTATAQTGGTFTKDTLTTSSSIDSSIRYFPIEFNSQIAEGYEVVFTIKTQRVSGTPVIVMYPEFSNAEGNKPGSIANVDWARDWAQKDSLQIVTGTFSQLSSFHGKAKYARVIFRQSGTGVFYITPTWYYRKKTGF